MPDRERSETQTSDSPVGFHVSISCASRVPLASENRISAASAIVSAIVAGMRTRTGKNERVEEPSYPVAVIFRCDWKAEASSSMTPVVVNAAAGDATARPSERASSKRTV